MRTFPKSLATLRQIISERSERLRSISFEDLKQLASQPSEHIMVESRPSTISVIVQARPDGSLSVVVQGFMKSRFLPGKHVAMDGFYKHPDGTVAPMPNGDLYDYE